MIRKVVFLASLFVISCTSSSESGNHDGSVADVQQPRQMEGVAVIGFEIETFQECGNPEVWALFVSSPNLPGYAILADALATAKADAGLNESWIRLRILGTVSEPGEFGHLGKFSRQIQVARVLAASPVTHGECHLPDGGTI